ncbi:hypothetical protein FOPE_12508 [Fonsecaea pedrosoi]|nr:hypothetical protein FOPE_12508 [Fonsecaea pedrosoi]
MKPHSLLLAVLHAPVWLAKAEETSPVDALTPSSLDSGDQQSTLLNAGSEQPKQIVCGNVMERFIAVKAVKRDTGKFTGRQYTLTIPDVAAESAMQVKAQIVLQPSSIVVRIMMDNIAVPDSVVLQMVYVFVSLSHARMRY